jgi:uncharacterized membrane protein
LGPTTLSSYFTQVGSPEKPLSDLGAVSYRSYWASTLLGIFKNNPLTNFSIMDLSKMTAIMNEDIISTLQYLGLLRWLPVPLQVIPWIIRTYYSLFRYVNGTYIIYSPDGLLDELIKKYVSATPARSREMI